MVAQDDAFRMCWHANEQMVEIGITKKEFYAALIMGQLMTAIGVAGTNKQVDDAADRAAYAADRLAKSLKKG